MIQRILTNEIAAHFNRRKIIVILGARQVGKTTLLEQLSQGQDRILNLNCDEDDNRTLIEHKTSTELKQLFAGYSLVCIDEAQRVENIGLTLKIIGDMKPDAKIIVTGSSSLDIADKINEPATGRLIEFNLYPLSMAELARNTSQKDETRLLEQRLIYGTYPEVVTDPNFAKKTLLTLTNSYLYKDILSFNGMRKPEVLMKLVKALALQAGSEVSYNELSSLVGINKETVDNYISLLEKCFVVFRLDSFSRNQRNEIKKGKKIYFYDNGIRNAVLSNFAPLELRNDCGALWENFLVSERKKRNAYCGSYAQLYFWRTHDQKEIDLVEEEDGVLRTFEFKWNPKKKNAKIPDQFAQSYPNHEFKVITKDNMWEFVI